MTRRTTLVLTLGLAVVLLWLLAGCTVADQRHRAEDPNGRLRASSAGSSGGDQHAEISNGKIAFIRHSDINVMNSDGTGHTNLTRTKAGVGGGVWSPNGKKIAFSARSTGERYLDIYVINASGTGETNLTRTKASSEGAPSWSPDSKRITYQRGSDPSGEIYNDINVMNSDGSSQTRLIKATDTKNFEVGFESPAWSPDGEKIAFMRTTRVDFVNSPPSSAVPATGPSGLYLMKPDGTGLRKLSKEMAYAQSPLWSPDGKKIAFAAVHYRGELDIYVIDADGTGQTNLTSTKTIIEDEPSWSPDGKQIAFTRADAGDVHADQDVYVMNANGTRRSRLASNASSPSFAPRDR